MNVIGQIPEFSEGSLNESSQGEEIKQPIVEETTVETETPAAVPADEKPADEVGEDTSEDLVQLQRAKDGLEKEKAFLLKQISELKGQRREIKQEQLITVQDKINDLTDVNPADVDLVEKVLKAKGYMTKAEAQQLSYQEVQNQSLKTFLDKYPEYKPENDPGDIKWLSLQQEYGLYAQPKDAHMISILLERAHKMVSPASGRDTAPIKRQQVKTASMGGGGVQRSSSKLPNAQLARLMETHMSGFTDEEKQQMLQRAE